MGDPVEDFVNFPGHFLWSWCLLRMHRFEVVVVKVDVGDDIPWVDWIILGFLPVVDR